MSRFDLKQTANKLLNNIKKAWKKIRSVHINPADAAVTAGVIILSCLVIVPSIVQCAQNRAKAACEHHMYVMLGVLGNTLEREAAEGGTYWQDLIINGNYQKLLRAINDKTGESGKFPASDYYIRAGENKLTIICKKHKDISEKEINFSAMRNINVNVTEKPVLAGKLAYIMVSGPDTYYVNDSLDAVYPDKMIFRGKEIDDVLQNLHVSAVYMGGYREELPRGRYTVTAEKLDMSKAGQTTLIVKTTSDSIWDNSAYSQFVIDVISAEDVAPLIVDGGINGRYELAQWEWKDYVEEASGMDGGEVFGASIIRYDGRFYYYPDGLQIINGQDNTNPFEFAHDTDDETKSAYYIEFDLDSVILNSSDEKNIHDGSLKAENGLVYIWQSVPSKELPAGWIRVYCELKKY